MEPILSHFASNKQGRFIDCLSPRITPRDSPSRLIPAQRHSSISMGQIAKATVQQLNGSNKSIGLSFTKTNKSKRSIRLQQSKENRNSAKQIESESRVTFKGVPPKRKRNPYKFYEGDIGNQFYQAGNRGQIASLLNGYFKNERSLSIEHFRIIKKLGEGSFSQVFLVVEKSTQALFALKVMEKEGLKELGVVDRLASQLKIQQYCNHINIVKLYGVFHDSDRIYLIQEFAGTKTLFSKMEESRIPAKQAQSIIRQLCNAVKFLHANNIIHRDIKPQNIMLAPGGVVKLTDFGWSVYNPGNSLRETICGTPLYLSPELISAQKYDSSVDLWAIGVLTYQLLTGQMPFGIKTVQDLRNIITEDIDLSRVPDAAARRFISILLTKQTYLRKDINQICEHEFLQENGKKE